MLRTKIIDILDKFTYRDKKGKKRLLTPEIEADQILSEVEKAMEECLPKEDKRKIRPEKIFDIGIKYGWNICREQTKTNFKKLL